jgi:hypothetical protein
MPTQPKVDLRVDRAFIRRWSRAYVESQRPDEALREAALFGEVGPAVRARGHFTIDEFLAVGEWKSVRARSKLRSNPAELVEAVTRQALAAPDERLSVLTSLRGVGAPIGSALLSVWDPTRYTVIDVRAEGALRAAGLLPATPATGYGLYLATCRRIADRYAPADADVSPLRALDRALWKWSEAQGTP